MGEAQRRQVAEAKEASNGVVHEQGSSRTLEILPAELAYLTVVIENYEAATKMQAAAEDLRQQADLLDAQAIWKRGSYESFLTYLRETYGLDNGDAITPEGRIIPVSQGA